ncbi:hypothetical protein [Solwaraspora sp. WMMD792]|uniref:hypothetical protein n=1 Tax=Solwaraspora sp. WMMD792 TaxID=3016099 RepID=UPI002415FC9E|nr:hypothetical protein [Solwaraspora sp. WMMD792]MDG4772254.1 hypothetical protein [Solwaraspora sp. WMMD792]
MTASPERGIEGAIVDVTDLPWSTLMSPGDNALGHAIRNRYEVESADHSTAADRLAEAVSAFNNYI